MCPHCGSRNTANVALGTSTLFCCAQCLQAAEVFQSLPDHFEAFSYECPLV